VRTFEFAGGRMVYMADQEVDSLIELYSVPIQGLRTPVKVSLPLVPSGVTNHLVSPDGRMVVYRATAQAGVAELFAASTVDGSRSQRVNAPLVAGGGVLPDFTITPDSKRVLFRADQDTDGMTELYVSYLTPPFLRVPSGRVP
jgi:hypothetical protein